MAVMYTVPHGAPVPCCHVTAWLAPPESRNGRLGADGPGAPSPPVVPLPITGLIPVTRNVAPPALRNTSRAVTGNPRFTAAGLSSSRSMASCAGACACMSTVAVPVTGTVMHVSPDAEGANPMLPLPATEYVHANVCPAPGFAVTGPAGTGPAFRTTSPAPGLIAIAGLTPTAACPPVFVTVSVTVTQSPAITDTGLAAAAESAPPAVTAPGADSSDPVVSSTPLFTSDPVAVAVTMTGPVTAPAYVHVNVTA